MALDPCVKSILCALSAVVLGALQGIINAQVGLLRAQLAILRAELLKYDIAAVPIEIARNAANAILNDARQAAALLPLSLIAECADLGELNINLVAAIDNETERLNDIIDDASAILSFREELNLAILQVERLIEAFEEILQEIAECAQLPPQAL